MPKCPKCCKEVYFAERVTSLGKDWHRPCLKCEKCNKTLSPGSHAEGLDVEAPRATHSNKSRLRIIETPRDAAFGFSSSSGHDGDEQGMEEEEGGTSGSTFASLISNCSIALSPSVSVFSCLTPWRSLTIRKHR
ncbi:cysteine-rich protein 1 [Silurus asotus]|uniref:Cysteine-rich protein 1 n=1 Tax=Silurus asotus TaxID=30991 RepID=A0AAD5AJ93_SILAS|nr:cysteine-rich protein 1 [Silurus asotus]